MKVLFALLLLASSPLAARASTPEIDQNLATLKTALSFVDIEPRDRQKLQAIEDQLEQSIKAESCQAPKPQQSSFTVTCRAIAIVTGEQRGSADATSSTSLDAATADAKDAALANCVATAVYKSDCEYIRAQDSFQCHQK